MGPWLGREAKGCKKRLTKRRAVHAARASETQQAAANEGASSAQEGAAYRELRNGKLHKGRGRQQQLVDDDPEEAEEGEKRP